jgi:hypothetical protein
MTQAGVHSITAHYANFVRQLVTPQQEELRG